MAPPRPSTRDDLTHPVAPRLEALILKCLEKELNDRPQSMSDVHEELNAISEELASAPPMPVTSSEPESESEPEPEPERSVPIELPGDIEPEDTAHRAEEDESPAEATLGRSGLIIGLATGVGLALGGVVAFFVMFGGNDATPVEPDPPEVQQPAASAEVATITLEFSSTPSGAFVYDRPDGPPIGKTPLTRSFDQIDRRQHFAIKKAGFVTAEADVSLARDGQLAVTLRPVPTKAQPIETTEAPDAGTAPSSNAGPTKVSKASGDRTRDRSPQTKRQTPNTGSSTPSSNGKSPARPVANNRRAVIDPFAD